MAERMADRSAELREGRPERADLLLWFAVLAGPLAWAFAELTSYSLAPTACWLGHPLVLYLVPIVPLLIVLGGAGLAWRRRHREPGEPEDSRARFMALAGFWLCLGFALAIVAFALPPLLLKVCD